MADWRQVNIGIHGIPWLEKAAHGAADGMFSLKFILESPLIFGNGFE